MTSTGPDPTSFLHGAQPGEGKPEDVASGLAGAAASLLESYAQIMTQFAGGAGGQSGTGAAPENMSGALVQAWSISSNSAVRYGQSLTEVMSRHRGELTDAASRRLSGKRLSDEELAAQTHLEVEQLRRFLREMGETATREARRFEHELEQLGESVARSIAPTMSEEDYKRSWAAKS